jgi:hypothetical protein
MVSASEFNEPIQIKGILRMPKMSRRQFLRGVAAAGVAIAATSIALHGPIALSSRAFRLSESTPPPRVIRMRPLDPDRTYKTNDRATWALPGWTPQNVVDFLSKAKIDQLSRFHNGPQNPNAPIHANGADTGFTVASFLQACLDRMNTKNSISISPRLSIGYYYPPGTPCQTSSGVCGSPSIFENYVQNLSILGNGLNPPQTLISLDNEFCVPTLSDALKQITICKKYFTNVSWGSSGRPFITDSPTFQKGDYDVISTNFLPQDFLNNTWIPDYATINYWIDLGGVLQNPICEIDFPGQMQELLTNTNSQIASILKGIAEKQNAGKFIFEYPIAQSPFDATHPRWKLPTGELLSDHIIDLMDQYN